MREHDGGKVFVEAMDALRDVQRSLSDGKAGEREAAD